MTAPILVLAWGNPARGDDALGLLLAERLRSLALPGVECRDEPQLQPEHALELAGRARVLFADASVSAAPPFEAGPVHAARDASYTSHAMSPAALLQAWIDLERRAPPPAVLLAIRGEAFALGDPPGAAALAHLDAAFGWALRWIAR